MILKKKAGSTRLELATFRVTGGRSNRLNYDPDKIIQFLGKARGFLNVPEDLVKEILMGNDFPTAARGDRSRRRQDFFLGK